MLNELLYQRLARRYGAVRVSKEDDPGTQHFIPAHLNPVSGEYVEPKYTYEGGEEYKICCPFCGDTKFHLYVNYRYGLPDPGGGTIMLAHCYHQCFTKPENREQFYYDLFLNPDGRKVPSVDPKMLATTVVPTPRKVSSIRNVVRLRDLPDDHPVWVYLQREREQGTYTRAELDPFQLGYCVDRENRLLYGRLVIPIFFHGEVVGWQARKFPDSIRGPKYYLAKNFTAGNYLYNYDTACGSPYVIVTEGPADVWRVGGSAVCLFGKALSSGQERALLNTWAGKPIGVMLDSDAQSEAVRLCEKLASKHRGPVLHVEIPKWYKDPGEVPSDIMREYLHGIFGC